MSATSAAIPAFGDGGAVDRRFFGHPLGLAYLCFTEAWERFSYYGMQSLLVLYMVDQLLLPGHVENIAGFSPLRRILEHGSTLSPQALGSAVFGLYTSSVYLTPILGGIVADRLLGKRRAITLGALLMTLGHFLMAFEVSFLAALLCLVCGCGLLKGNIASQVGALYSVTDNRRADAYQLFYLGINAGVIVSPLITGTLGEVYGWHWGFGAAGVGMVIGLTIYLSGQRYLPPDPGRVARNAPPRAALKPDEVRRLAILIALLPVLAIAAVGNQQIFNAYLIWAQRNADFVFFGMTMPTTWLITYDAIVSVGFLMGTVLFWRAWAKRFPEPDDMTKIALGALISVAGTGTLALGAFYQEIEGGKVPLIFLAAFHILNAAGFANIFPVSLALYSRVAPAAVNSTILGVFYLHLFAANLLVGWIGGFLELMPATEFWALHAGMSLFAGLVFLAARRSLGSRG